MLIASCSYSRCKLQPFFSCSCSNSLSYCNIHLNEHIQSKGNHVTSNLSTSVSESLKQKIIKSLNKSYKLCNTKLKELISCTSNAINFITYKSNKACEKIMSEIKNISSTIDNLLKNSLVHKDVLDAVNSSKDSWTKYLKFDYDGIIEAVSKSYNLGSCYPDMRDDDYAIILKADGSNEIDVVDLDNFKKTTIKFKTPMQYFDVCKIDHTKVFIHGQSKLSDKFTNYPISQFFEFKKNTFSKIENIQLVPFTGLVLCNKEIYAFGDQSSCKKLNLINKVLINIQPLPESRLNGSTASIINSNIIITGTRQLLVYYPLFNSYAYCKYDYPAVNFTYIFENWIVCFSDYLYEINDEGVMIRYQGINDPGNFLNSSACFKRGKYIYFTLAQYNKNDYPALYRINTFDKTIDSIVLSNKA